MGKNAAAKKTGVIRVVRNNSYYTYSDVMELEDKRNIIKIRNLICCCLEDAELMETM
ncbi:MAG: hypothetical protein IJ141_10725 [Lachnospiraceae bacterium]|nr:hypothetical protein [Lachnospiraceae bacterium]